MIFRRIGICTTNYGLMINRMGIYQGVRLPINMEKPKELIKLIETTSTNKSKINPWKENTRKRSKTLDTNISIMKRYQLNHLY